VIGTGASGIQIIPEVAKVALHTTVFQRTPPYVLPRRDPPFTPEEQQRFATDRAELARVRDELYRTYEGATFFRLGDPTAAIIADLAREHLALIADEDLRAKVTPQYALGCNRVLVSSDYYPALQRADVELVTDEIERVVPNGVVTAGGRVRELDALVLATGFRAGEYLTGIDVTGRDGDRLHDRWSDAPYAYLGMTVSGFPNLFVFYGPNTNQGGNSIILILEAQAAYVRRALAAMERAGLVAVDVRDDVLAEYDRATQDEMARTVWGTGCNSYFTNPAGRVVTQLPHTSAWYARRTEVFDLDEYHCRRARTGA
jgi:cation diffusion facilitator CzcD-associated flavoprotein CzcO